MKSICTITARTSQTHRLMLGLLITASSVLPHLSAQAQLPVPLGSLTNVAVLAGSALTSTQGGTINGNVGINPGSTFILGIPPVTVNGATNLADGVSLLAQTDLTAAYLDAQGRGPDVIIAGGQLAGIRYAGVYKDNGAPASLNLTGALILDAQGDPDAVWIFQSASTLIAEVDSVVVLLNGAKACNVFWQVGSAATLRTRASFRGTIMAVSAITMENLATLEGRALASTESAVTLDNNTINIPICDLAVDDGSGFTIAKSLTNAYFEADAITPRPPRIGEAMNFVITIVNTGLVDLVSVAVVDTYDATQLQYANATPPSVNNVNDGAVNWINVGPLTAGASTSLVANFSVICGGASPFGTNQVAALAATDTNVAPTLAGVAVASYAIEHGFLGDTVWVDLNGNGLPDENLAVYGLNGVRVRLYEIVGIVTNFVGETLTATLGGLRGRFAFEGLSATGDYHAVVDRSTVPVTLAVNTSPLAIRTGLTDCGSLATADFGFMSASPTAVEMGEIQATVSVDRVQLGWSTLTERDNAGFNVYRAATPDGPRVQVNDTLIGGVGTGEGQAYTFAEATPLANGTYFYWIEDVDYDGTVRVQEPVKVEVGPPPSTIELLGSAALSGPGLYAVSAETFRHSGLHPAAVDASRLRVYVDDREVAAYITTDNSSLADWDYVLFYAEEGQRISLGYDEGAPLRMNFRFVFLEQGEGETLLARVTDEAAGMRVALSREHVRYLITGFHETMVWLLDVTDVRAPSVLLGAEIVQAADETGVYFSEPTVTNGTVFAVGSGAIKAIELIEP